MNGYIQNIDILTLDNKDFRRVLYTAKHCQLVAMSLKPGEDIGMEVHHLDSSSAWRKDRVRRSLMAF